MLEHVTAINRGPLDAPAIRRLFERIIDEARRIVAPLSLFASRTAAELDRRRSVAALGKSEVRYRQLFDRAAMGIIVLDANRRIVDVNRAVFRAAPFFRSNDAVLADPVPERQDAPRERHAGLRVLSGRSSHAGRRGHR